VPRPTRRLHRPALLLLTLVMTTSVLLTGCGEDQTGQPGVTQTDFSPRLVVTVDDRGLTATVGPRGEGDERVSADPARLPAGSVMEIRFAGTGEARVVGTLTAPGATPADPEDRDVATSAPLVDTGIQFPGDDVTVVLADPGTLVLSPRDEPSRTLTVEISPSAAAG
jgi:hypothetical protein